MLGPRRLLCASAVALTTTIAFTSLAVDIAPASAATGDPGSTTAERALDNDPSTLWMGTFDNAPDWKANWGIDNFPHAANNTIVSKPFAPNGKVLQTTASAQNNGFTGLGVDFRPSFDRMGIGARNEATLRYSVYFPDDFDWYAGGKLPGLSGISAGEGAFSTAGGGDYHPTSWSGRTLFLSGGRMKAYLYVKHANGLDIEQNLNPANGRTFGISPIWNKNADARQGPQVLRKGAWNTIELHYRMNTPGQNNGLFEGRMNGELGVRLTDVQYRDATHPNLSLNQMFFTSFFGGPTSNKTDETWYFDDVSIAGPGAPALPAREDVSAYGVPFHGATTKVPLAAPLVGIAPTASGNGYWLLAKDGGIFSYGDAALPGLDREPPPGPAGGEPGIRPPGSGLLVRGRRRRRLQLRRPVLRLDGRPNPVPPGRRHGRHPHGQRLLARGRRRRDLLLRRRRLLRLHRRHEAEPAHRGHGRRP